VSKVYRGNSVYKGNEVFKTGESGMGKVKGIRGSFDFNSSYPTFQRPTGLGNVKSTAKKDLSI
jgi:hypothetical protein